MNRSLLFAAIALGCWFGIAAGAAHAGLLLDIAPPLVIAPLTALVLVALWLMQPVRSWLRTRLVQLVRFHVIRVIGFAFLVLYRDARLPFEFAIPAGFGDIAIALAALFLGLYVDAKRSVTSQPALLAWNVLGLIDVVSAVTIAMRFFLQNPDSVLPLRVLPASLIPTFLVPLLIASHLLIFAWAWSERRPSRQV
jgi:hypothetical protein